MVYCLKLECSSHQQTSRVFSYLFGGVSLKIYSLPRYLGLFFLFIYSARREKKCTNVHSFTLTTMVFAFCLVHHLAICVLLRLFFMKLLEITNILYHKHTYSNIQEHPYQAIVCFHWIQGPVNEGHSLTPKELIRPILILPF